GRTQGRPGDRTANSVVPRAPQVGADRAAGGAQARPGRLDRSARREGGGVVNLLVVGVSHRTADVALLERLTMSPADVAANLATLLAKRHVNEAVVLSTCNRVEIYTS